LPDNSRIFLPYGPCRRGKTIRLMFFALPHHAETDPTRAEAPGLSAGAKVKCVFPRQERVSIEFSLNGPDTGLVI
jgi:hypothetical protein